MMGVEQMNMKCKLILATATLVLLTATIAVPFAHSNGSTTLYVKPQKTYSFVAQSFTINVSIENVENLNFWEVQLAFNPAILNCSRAKVPPDNIFTGYSPELPPPEISNTAGHIRIAAFLWDPIGVSGSGTLFQAEFQAKIKGTSALTFINLNQTQGTLLLDPSSTLISFETVNGLVEVGSSERYLSVPFHHQEKIYYSGPASLKMLFDFYGEDIPQLEIAEVARTHPNVTFTDELRRAAHFNNMSTSKGQEMPENITGYSVRKLGYGAFEKETLNLNQLKNTVYNGYPVIVSTWYDLSKQNSHYRVIVGYNDTHIIVHDPWNKTAWGGTHGGPNTALDYSTFLTLWNQSNYWGLLVSPWKVTVAFKMLEYYLFNVTANVQYVCPETFGNTLYPASSAKATIILPSELSLEMGESTTKTLGTGNLSSGASAEVSWMVTNITDINEIVRNITVEATGIIDGNVTTHGVYQSYSYQDIIGGINSKEIWLGFPGDLTGDGKVDIRDIARVARAFGSYSGDPRWDPVADVTGPENPPGSGSYPPDGKVDIRDIAFVAKRYGIEY